MNLLAQMVRVTRTGQILQPDAQSGDSYISALTKACTTIYRVVVCILLYTE